TYSIGFRSPSRKELIGSWCDDLLPKMTDDDRYSDPDLAVQANPGEISANSIDRLHAMLTEKLTDRREFARWFGEYSSTPRYPDTDWRPEELIEIEHLRGLLTADNPLLRNPASRFSFIRENEVKLLLFVDGDCFTCADDMVGLAEMICAHDQFVIDPEWQTSDAVVALLADLYNRGSLSFDWG
ncbi:winged helix domain-containing protein, partial [Parasphingorhabdus sp.]|uniref:winged helix domain-containing protein n=1 Tax=Parasphingorhabdus sp. TaxID=2709688 RepID=UPI003C751B9E